jgi:VWFA-related protein
MAAIGMLLASLLCLGSVAQPLQKTPIYVTASFLDRNRLFIENLSRDEVRIFENGKPREVEYLAGEEVPAVYGMLFDRSLLAQTDEAMDILRRDQTNVPGATAAVNVAYQLLDLCLKGQVGWVAAYDQQMRIAIDASQDPGRIRETIQQLSATRSPEESSLYNALFTAIKKMSQRHEKRRTLIVFLDVVDVETSGKLRPLKNLLSASNVELFVASFASRGSTIGRLLPAQSDVAMRELADVTAGGAYSKTADGIEGMGRRISNQIRTYYTIGFLSETPSDQPGRLTIECTRPGSKAKTHPVVPTLQ